MVMKFYFLLLIILKIEQNIGYLLFCVIKNLEIFLIFMSLLSWPFQFIIT